MKNRKLILLVAIVLAFLFYWYEIRPARIRISCVSSAGSNSREQLLGEVDRSGGLQDLENVAELGDYMNNTYKYYYQRCLNQKGLK